MRTLLVVAGLLLCGFAFAAPAGDVEAIDAVPTIGGECRTDDVRVGNPDSGAAGVAFCCDLTGGVPGTWGVCDAQNLSINAFGAVGDGATDDATAIQAAVDAAELLGGIVTANGNQVYNVESNITVDESNVTVDLRNAQFVGSHRWVFGTQGHADGDRSGIPTNVHFRNARIGDGGTDDVLGVQMFWVDDCSVENVVKDGISGSAILMYMTERCVVRNVIVRKAKDTGSGAIGLLSFHSSHLLVDNFHVDGEGAYPFVYGLQVKGGYYNTIRNSSMRDVVDGATVAADVGFRDRGDKPWGDSGSNEDGITTYPYSTGEWDLPDEQRASHHTLFENNTVASSEFAADFAGQEAMIGTRFVNCVSEDSGGTAFSFAIAAGGSESDVFFSRVKAINPTLQGISIAGLSGTLLPRVTIEDSLVEGAGLEGITASYTEDLLIRNTIVRNSGQTAADTYDGVEILTGNVRARVENVLSYDDQGSPTQKRGVRFSSASTDSVLIGGHFHDNVTTDIADQATDSYISPDVIDGAAMVLSTDLTDVTVTGDLIVESDTGFTGRIDTSNISGGRTFSFPNNTGDVLVVDSADRLRPAGRVELTGVLSLEGTSPDLEMLDTSQDDDDPSFIIAVDATATGTGAEDVDVSLSSLVGGSMDEFIKRDASENTTIVDGTVTLKDDSVGSAQIDFTQYLLKSRITGSYGLTYWADGEEYFEQDIVTDSNIMHKAFNAVAGGILDGGITLAPDTVTASTTQSQGQQQLTTQVVNVDVVANTNDVVTLMDFGDAGFQIVVNSDSAETLQVFPKSGDDLGLGADASTTVDPGYALECWSTDASTGWCTQWDATAAPPLEAGAGGDLEVTGDLTIGGALNHDGSTVGFYGVAPVVQPTQLTSSLTTITHTAPSPSDYAIQDMTSSGLGAVYGFATQDEANTVLSVVANLQTRVDELETKLTAVGLLSTEENGTMTGVTLQGVTIQM